MFKDFVENCEYLLQCMPEYLLINKLDYRVIKSVTAAKALCQRINNGNHDYQPCLVNSLKNIMFNILTHYPYPLGREPQYNLYDRMQTCFRLFADDPNFQFVTPGFAMDMRTGFWGTMISGTTLFQEFATNAARIRCPNYERLIRYMLQNHANPDLITNICYLGNTALISLIANAYNFHAKLLIKTVSETGLRMDLDIGSNYLGNTALILSVAKGHNQDRGDGFSNHELTHFLLEHGASVNLQDRNGNTALHIACARRDLVAVRILLTAGADPTILSGNQDGTYPKRTPIDMLELSYEESHTILQKQTGPDTFFPDPLDGSGETYSLPTRKEFEAINCEVIRSLIATVSTPYNP